MVAVGRIRRESPTAWKRSTAARVRGEAAGPVSRRFKSYCTPRESDDAVLRQRRSARHLLELLALICIQNLENPVLPGGPQVVDLIAQPHFVDLLLNALVVMLVVFQHRCQLRSL